MKKLTLIAALLATTLGAVGTAQAGGQNQVAIQAIPTNAQIVVVNARPHKAVNTVTLQAVKPVVKKVVVVKKPAKVVKKVVVVKKPAKVVKKVIIIQKPARHHKRAGTVVDRVVNKVAVTHATPVRVHRPMNHVTLQAVHVK